MDAARFDALARTLSLLRPSRRGALAGLAGGLLAGLPFGLSETAAKRKKKKKKKKKKNQTPPPPPGGACVPSCERKTCGNNGCGGSCGQCGDGNGCVDGACRAGCPGNQILCGDLCVDPDDNEQHCGGCNRPCQGDLTCLSGACRCAVGTMCGNHCVDLQTDPDHCGACNDPCDNDASCVGGACHPAGCGANQIDCGGGLCIANHEHACCSQAACGGSNSQLHCDTALHRCVCNASGEGICRRSETGGGGLCHTCCPGGAEVCLRDHVCFVLDSELGPLGICACPTGYETCHFGLSHRCTRDRLTDIHRCGTDCTDCTTDHPGARCCQGGCARGKNPGTPGEDGMLCGVHCQQCDIGFMCCNSGPGTSGECVDVGTGICP